MKHKEVEYKYWATISKETLLGRMKNIATEDAPCIYVVSCDDYYTRNCEGGKDFVRFRKGGGRYELTLKRKERNNLIRKEINLNVTNNDDSSIVEFLRLSGYSKAFQVYKEAWIWETPDCDISYYTLSDGRSVIELEAKNYNTTREAVASIDKWEEALGLQSLDKESRSLYEIFTEERGLDFVAEVEESW